MGKWLSMMRRDDFIPKSSSRLCSDHFSQDCFEQDLKIEHQLAIGYKHRPKRHLKRESVPTLFAHSYGRAVDSECPLSSWQKQRDEHERRNVGILRKGKLRGVTSRLRTFMDDDSLDKFRSLCPASSTIIAGSLSYSYHCCVADRSLSFG